MIPLINILGAGYLANEGLGVFNQFMEGNRQEKLGMAQLDFEKTKLANMTAAQKNLYKALMDENHRQEGMMLSLRKEDRVDARDKMILAAFLQKLSQPDLAPMLMAQSVNNLAQNMPQVQGPPLPPTSLTSMLRM